MNAASADRVCCSCTVVAQLLLLLHLAWLHIEGAPLPASGAAGLVGLG